MSRKKGASRRVVRALIVEGTRKVDSVLFYLTLQCGHIAQRRTLPGAAFHYSDCPVRECSWPQDYPVPAGRDGVRAENPEAAGLTEYELAKRGGTLPNPPGVPLVDALPEWERIARQMLQIKPGGPGEATKLPPYYHDLRECLRNIDELCQLAGGRLNSRQIIAAEIARWYEHLAELHRSRDHD